MDSRPIAAPDPVLVHELPIVPSGAPPPRSRRMARWRAVSLILVHLLIAAHVAHWLATERTLSPLEPSEAMYALELGHVNAGLIFFGLAILSTLVFGRFFCGWACHVVALQDLCGWLLRRIGIKPQPLRSRLLLLAPFVLAAYMFGWPTFRRVVLGAGPPFPGFSNHLVTTSFWQTFPGPVFAVLTLLSCGFLAVWVLGSKGFCTYGCPYGAFFTVADRLAPVRIVADGCRQSGRCTSTCTSNVRVNEEVLLHRMVVDPRCMKCMDCVAGCPNGALSLGVARPPLATPQTPGGRASWRTLRIGEELLVAAVALAATLALRGLYDGPPLLMAVGLGGVTGYAALKLVHLARRRTVRLQSLGLRVDGITSPTGRIFAVVGVAWLAFLLHSGFVQWHRARGRVELARTQVARVDALAGTFDEASMPPAHRQSVARARRHFALADRWGLVRVDEVELGLAWVDLLGRKPQEAERRIRSVLARHPSAGLHDDLVELLVARGRVADAIDALAAKGAQAAPSARDHFRMGQLLAHSGRLEEASRAFAASVDLAPSNAAARYNLGAVLLRLGRPEEAAVHLAEADRLAPGDPQTRRELADARERPAAL